MAVQKTSQSPGKEQGWQTVVLLAAITLFGGGGGAFLGMTLKQPSSVPLEQASCESGDARDSQKLMNSGHPTATTGPHDAQNKSEGSPDSDQKHDRQALQIKELPPIVTNLGVPETSWVRLQASIVYDPKAVTQPDVLVAELTSDLVAFLRTVSLASIEGAQGLRRLHEDLSERAAVRSEGRIREFIIQALVVQ